jgi:hypothetical protein
VKHEEYNQEKIYHDADGHMDLYRADYFGITDFWHFSHCQRVDPAKDGSRIPAQFRQ